MGLPIRFTSVNYYRIAGKYIFAGDLFITREAIYFFPEVDLDQQREKITRYVPHNFALLVFLVLYIKGKFGGFYLSRTKFWREGLLPEEFEQHARLYMECLRAEKAHAAFAKTLPLPIRIGAKEITDMKLSPSGRLSFTAQSDRHDFRIGLIKKKTSAQRVVGGGLGPGMRNGI